MTSTRSASANESGAMGAGGASTDVAAGAGFPAGPGPAEQAASAAAAANPMAQSVFIGCLRPRGGRRWQRPFASQALERHGVSTARIPHWPWRWYLLSILSTLALSAAAARG